MACKCSWGERGEKKKKGGRGVGSGVKEEGE